MKAILSTIFLFIAMLLTGIEAKAEECTSGCGQSAPCQPQVPMPKSPTALS